jgi:nucleotide-binding universal stress UspA family protein
MSYIEENYMTKTNAPTLIPTETVVWAIDPFEEEVRPGQHLVHQLINWARISNLELQPVYILEVPRSVSSGFLEGGGLSPYIAAAEKYSEKYLRHLGVIGVRPVKVIIPESSTRKEKIDVLLKFAKEQSSQCIILSSHGRSGVQKLVLGSFAENLLLQSKCPVFFLTHLPKANEDGRHFERVLFATDFSDRSKEEFLDFLLQAKRFHFQVSLFHSVSLPEASLASGFGTPVLIPDDFFSSQIKWAKAKGAIWVELAKSHGVQVKFIVKNDGIGTLIAETINSAAHQEGAGVIALGSTSGALSSFTTGSVAHDVFQSGVYPVWLYGPKALENNRPLERAEQSH